MVSMETGLSSTYFTETCALPSGRKKGTVPFFRTSASLACDLVCQRNWQRHQFWSLFTGIPEHQSLISCTNLTAFLVNTLIDIGTLFPDTVQYTCRSIVKTITCICITNFPYRPCLAISCIGAYAVVLSSPAITQKPLLSNVSQATRA